MATICFDYQDSRGNISTRELASWADDGWLIKGFCTRDKGPRTFRRDRILVVHEGAELLKPIEQPAHVAASAPPSPRAKRADTLEIEILFTGFPKARRAELESAASDADMRLRKTVTQALSFICAGPNAGPTKLLKAQGQGVAVLDESDFLWLLQTGEMPE